MKKELAGWVFLRVIGGPISRSFSIEIQNRQCRVGCCRRFVRVLQVATLGREHFGVNMTESSFFKLTGKTALVTGAGAGIGKAIAHAFSASGAFVYVADINSETAEAVAGELRAEGREADFLTLDVASPEACEAALERLTRDGRPLDVLVNNAGIGKVGTLLDTTGDDLDAIYNVNVKGVFNTCKAFLPGMVERESGNIINMASIGGIVGVRERLAYCMSKFAVVGMTKTMALDHAKQGIRVNCICPGRVHTEFVDRLLEDYDDPKAAYEQMSSTQLLGRMGKPDEVAAAALYLAADESAFVTGTAFLIDGGWSAGN